MSVDYAAPCRECGNANPADHVYGERKCCPDCDHRAATTPDDLALLRHVLTDPTADPCDVDQQDAADELAWLGGAM